VYSACLCHAALQATSINDAAMTELSMLAVKIGAGGGAVIASNSQESHFSITA
jgi:hypothetical protein